jgi:hypothetical protein
MSIFEMAPCPGSAGISVAVSAEAEDVVSSSEDAFFLVKKPGSGGRPCKFVEVLLLVGARRIVAAARNVAVLVVVVVAGNVKE